MGNCVSLSLPLDQTVNNVSQWLGEKGRYTHNLKKNLVVMEITMEELKAKRDDLSRRLNREEHRGLQRLAEFQVWLTRVETIENIVNDLLSGRNVELHRLCLCGICSKSLRSSCSYGKSVVLTLKEVEKLKSQVFEVIAEQTLTFEVEERQLPLTIVGQETILDKAWKHLMKEGVGIMGLYGMGGVGKTTVLTQINNKFSNNKYGFDVVIWLVVSKELHVEKIQDEIAQEVGLGVEWKQKDKSQKSNILYNFLRKKRFVLFLDDIWEKVELAEIGIPFPTRQNKCKVAFTTRSQDVCARMGVEDPMEVQCLAENEAYDLFQKKVGQITLGSDPEIPNLARIVAKKCCGLPLALDVIGETMSCKRSIHEWHHAIYVLNSYAAEFCGMEDKVLPLLKYSYDNIKGKKVKLCLLYCSLFPEDDRIPKEKLIEYWICEGIIDGSEGIERAEYKGYEIIGSLVRASLLMEWTGLDNIEMVYMHDVVREMALWIASDLGIQKEAFIVRAGVGLDRMPNIRNWSVVRRMSLMSNKIHHLIGSPNCKELKTLLLQRTELEDISSEFFKSMPKLVVLDLSGNHKLSKFLDGISKLVSLQYLNLSGTAISHLPKGLQELKKLMHLDLERTSKLLSIAGISSLHNLKVLKLHGSPFSWDLYTVNELETLKHLETLTTTVDLTRSWENLLSSQRLMRCTRYLKISDNSFMGSSGIPLPLYMDKLRNFEIIHCSISEIKMGTSFLSLVKLTIDNCKNLKELTFLMLAPNLKYLFVGMANQLEDIINKEKACEGGEPEVVPFPKLVYLCLSGLPELKSIYWSPLPLPCLKIIEVSYCPNLKTLPLDSRSGKHELVIGYQKREWITSVEWEDEATKARFLASC